MASSLRRGKQPAGGGAAGGNEDPTERLETWDWVFEALWEAAGAIAAAAADTGGTAVASGGLSPLRLAVPDTVLFQKGVPHRWVGTSADGTVVQKHFPRSDPAASSDSIATHRIRAARLAFLEHRRRYVGVAATDTDPAQTTLCRVWYRDGRCEVLDLERFDLLVGHTLWLTQVLGMQAYTPVQITHTLEYAGGQIHEHGSDGMGVHCQTLLAHLQASFTSHIFAPKVAFGAAKLQPRISLVSFIARFIIDEGDAIWFEQLDNVVTRATMPEQKPFKRDRDAEGIADIELLRAADELETSFRKLLQEAVNRGMTLSQCFGHFDAAGTGMVAPPDFIAGMRMLGMDAHPAVLKELVSRIPRNAVRLIGREQFTIFCETGSQPIRPGSTPGAHRHHAAAPPTPSHFGLDKSASTSSLGRVRGLARAETSQDSLLQTHVGNAAWAGEDGPPAAPPGVPPPSAHGISERALLSNTTSSIPTSTTKRKGTKKKLPAKLTSRQPSSSRDDEYSIPKGKSEDDLYGDHGPKWARESTKKALAELRAAQAARAAKAEALKISVQLPAKQSFEDLDMTHRSAPQTLADSSLADTADTDTADSQHPPDDEDTPADPVDASHVRFDGSSRKPLASLRIPPTSPVQVAQSGVDSSVPPPSISAAVPTSTPSLALPKPRSRGKLKTLPALSSDAAITSRTPRGADKILWVTPDACVAYRVRDGPPLPSAESSALPSPATDAMSTTISGPVVTTTRPGFPHLTQVSAINGAATPLPAATPGARDPSLTAAPQGAAAANAAAAARGITKTDILTMYSTGHPVDFLVLPDMFDTAELLDAALQHLLFRLPGSRCLLVQYPGQPHAEFDDRVDLTTDYLADCVVGLIKHVQAAGEWGVASNGLRRDLIVVGAGIGAHIAFQLSAKHLVTLGLRGSLRALVALNPYAALDQGLKQCFSRLVRLHDQRARLNHSRPASQARGRSRGKSPGKSPSRPQSRSKSPGGGADKNTRGPEQEAAHSEVVVHLVSLVFGSSFLSKLTRPGAQQHLQRVLPELMDGTITADGGVVALARGQLKSADQRVTAAKLRVPMLVIAGSEDAFVVPLHSQAINESRNVDTVCELPFPEWLRASKDTKTTHTMWLKAGHWLMQERAPFVLTTLEQVALGRVTSLSEQEWAAAALEPPKLPTPRPLDAVIWTPQEQMSHELGQPRQGPGLDTILTAGYGGAGGTRPQTSDINSIKALLKAKGLSLAGTRYELIARLEAALDAEAAEAQAKIAAARSKKREDAAVSRALRAAEARRDRERKIKMEERARRMSEAELLRHAAEVAREREQQRVEVANMAYEDRWTRMHDDWLRQQARHKMAAEQAVKQVAELVDARAKAAEEEALKEATLAAADVREARRAKAEAMREAIANQSVTVPGDELGYAFDSEVVDEVVEGVQRLINDVSELRTRKQTSVARWRRLDTRLRGLHGEKTTLTKELDTIDAAIRASIRDANAALKYGSSEDMDEAVVEAARQEQEHLRDKRAELLPFLDAVDAQLTIAMGEMDGVNTNVQRIAVAADNKEAQLQQMRIKLAKMITVRRVSRRQGLEQQERLVTHVAELRASLLRQEQRLKDLLAESTRLKKVKSRYVTTMVWQAGVAQEIKTKELRIFVAKELHAIGPAIDEITEQVTKSAADAETVGASAGLAERELAVLQKELRSIVTAAEAKQADTAADMQKWSPREHAVHWNGVQARAVVDRDLAISEMEEQGAQLAELGATFEADGIHINRHIKRAVLVRWKPGNERNNDERAWVGADRLMFPEIYRIVSVEDAEMYKHDPTYKCDFTRERLAQLASLPKSLASSFPQLRDPAEKRMFCLLLTYLHGHGEDDDRFLDQNSGPIVTAALAMTRGYTARVKFPTQRTLEERQWVALDAVLRPHLHTEAALVVARRALGWIVDDAVEADDQAITRNAAALRKNPAAHFQYLRARKEQQAQRRAIADARQKGTALPSSAIPKVFPGGVDLTFWLFMGGKFSNPADPMRASDDPSVRCEFTRLQLQAILSRPPAALSTDRERHVQLLLRAYGSDDGKALAQAAAYGPSPVVRRLADVPDQLLAIEEQVRRNQEIRLMRDAIHGNVAAAALTAAQGAVFVHSDAVQPVMSVTDQQVGPGITREHVFYVTPGVNLANLSVVMTLRGSYDVRGYVPGRISVGWYRLPLAPADLVPPVEAISRTVARQSAQTASTSLVGSDALATSGLPVDAQAALQRTPVGYVISSECDMCTEASFGKLLMRHEPMLLPVTVGGYVIVVTGAAPTTYSIHISGDLMYTAEQAVEGAVRNAQQAAARIPTARLELDDLQGSIRLGKWKARLIVDLIARTEAQLAATEALIGRLRTALQTGKAVRKDLGPAYDSDEDSEDNTSEDEEAEEKSQAESEPEDEDEDAEDDEEEDDEEEDEDEEDKNADPAARAAEADRKKRRARRIIDMTERIHERTMARIAKLEVDYSDLVQALKTRKTELEDVYAGVNEMTAAVGARESEILDLQRNIKQLEKDIPRVVDALRCMSDDEMQARRKRQILERHGLSTLATTAAGHTALGGGTAMTQEELDVAQFGIDTVEWLEEMKAGSHVVHADTPAERIRRKALEDLTEEEKTFLSMDRVMNPDRYQGDIDGYEGELDQATSDLLKAAEQAATNKSDGAAQAGVAAAAALQAAYVPTLAPGAAESAAASKVKSKYDQILPPCPLSKSEITRIRDTPLFELSKEEAPMRKILAKFHDRPAPTVGALVAEQAAAAADAGASLGERSIQANRTVKQVLAAGKLANRVQRDALRTHFTRIRFDAEVVPVGIDVDLRCKQLLAELDRAFASSNKFMDSTVIHGVEQRFPVDVLRRELERELDTQLLSQVFEREQIVREDYNKAVLRVRSKALELEDIKNEAKRKQVEEERRRIADRAAQALVANKQYGEAAGTTVRRAQMAAAAAKAARALDEKDPRLGEEMDDPIKAMGDVIKWGSVRPPVTADELVKTSVSGQNTLGAKRRRAALARAKAEEARALGAGGCLACKTAPCSWRPCVDLTAEEHRVRVLELELFRLSKLPAGTVFVESDVPRSVKLGGTKRSLVADFKYEMESELRIVQSRIRLLEVDKELHRAHASHADSIETVVLHGYSQMSWRTDAIVALTRESTVLIAKQVSYEIVDDILDWMLEGWHFGERQSQLPIAGYVPSIRKDRPLRPAESKSAEAQELAQMGAAAQAAAEAKAVLASRNDDPDALPAVYLEDKWQPIDAAAQARKVVRKAVEAGSAVDHSMKETETTLRFGLFCLSLMYFRAMSSLAQQKDMWSGKGELHKSRNKTAERDRIENAKRARDRRQNAIQRSLQVADKVLNRQAHLAAEERSAARRKLAAQVRLREAEKKAANKIQAAFRGYLARLAVHKWALKKREIDAVRALRTAGAITIQRVYRGHIGRQIAADKQREMAAFIRMVRTQEEKELEEDYYATHTVERWKRNWRRWLGAEKRAEDPTSLFKESKYEKDSVGSSSEEDEEDDDEDAADGEGNGDDGGGDNATEAESDVDQDEGAADGDGGDNDGGSSTHSEDKSRSKSANSKTADDGGKDKADDAKGGDDEEDEEEEQEDGDGEAEDDDAEEEDEEEEEGDEEDEEESDDEAPAKAKQKASKSKSSGKRK